MNIVSGRVKKKQKTLFTTTNQSTLATFPIVFSCRTSSIDNLSKINTKTKPPGILTHVSNNTQHDNHQMKNIIEFSKYPKFHSCRTTPTAVFQIV